MLDCIYCHTIHWTIFVHAKGHLIQIEFSPTYDSWKPNHEMQATGLKRNSIHVWNLCFKPRHYAQKEGPICGELAKAILLQKPSLRNFGKAHQRVPENVNTASYPQLEKP